MNVSQSHLWLRRRGKLALFIMPMISADSGMSFTKRLYTLVRWQQSSTSRMTQGENDYRICGYSVMLLVHVLPDSTTQSI